VSDIINARCNHEIVFETVCTMKLHFYVSSPMNTSIVTLLMGMVRQPVLYGRTRNSAGLCVIYIVRVVCVGFAAGAVVLGQIALHVF